MVNYKNFLEIMRKELTKEASGYIVSIKKHQFIDKVYVINQFLVSYDTGITVNDLYTLYTEDRLDLKEVKERIKSRSTIHQNFIPYWVKNDDYITMKVVSKKLISRVSAVPYKEIPGTDMAVIFYYNHPVADITPVISSGDPLRLYEKSVANMTLKSKPLSYCSYDDGKFLKIYHSSVLADEEELRKMLVKLGEFYVIPCTDFQSYVIRRADADRQHNSDDMYNILDSSKSILSEEMLPISDYVYVYKKSGFTRVERTTGKAAQCMIP